MSVRRLFVAKIERGPDGIWLRFAGGARETVVDELGNVLDEREAPYAVARLSEMRALVLAGPTLIDLAVVAVVEARGMLARIEVLHGVLSGLTKTVRVLDASGLAIPATPHQYPNNQPIVPNQ